MTPKKRAKLVCKLKKVCDALYSSKTSKKRRRELSMDATLLRAELGSPTVNQMLDEE